MVALPKEFVFQDGQLSIEGVLFQDIAIKYGTPIYCYSASAIKRNYLEFSSGLPDSIICYALKANSNHLIVKMLANLGSGADVVSGGELDIALSAGIPSNKIVFSGVGKLDSEIINAIDKSIQLNVESLEEFVVISELAKICGVKARVAFRFNPDVDADTHGKITTGLKSNKFGLSKAQIFEAINMRLEMVDIVGISVHIGSQIMNIEVFRAVVDSVKIIISELRNLGIIVKIIDMGGGLGVDIASNIRKPSISSYAKLMRDITDKIDVQFIYEPGRSIVADAGVLLSKVLFKKDNGEGFRHMIIDAGMNDFMRPAMYGVESDVMAVKASAGSKKELWSISGPVCESSDCFNPNCAINPCKRGDLVLVCCSGAYGSSMAGTYNSRPLVKELLVNQGKISI